MLKIAFIFTLLLSVSSLWARKITFPLMGRNFTLVVPEKNSPSKKPLLVLLHGCKMNPETILQGTGLENEALQNNFFILIPEQSLIHNVDRCWNWFLGFNQERNLSNEMAQIMSGVEFVINHYGTNRDQTFVAGISAGGVMAHGLAACYPDYFRGAAIHSGLSYKVAENALEAQTVLTSSRQKPASYLGQKVYQCGRQVESRRLDRMILIHGEEDKRVTPNHSELISKTNAVLIDYLDDGVNNRSNLVQKNEVVLHFPNSYSARVTDLIYSNVNFTERTYMVKGLAHAWGGGNPVSVNFDSNAPSSNEFILSFFQLKR